MVLRERGIWVGALILWATLACFNRLGEPPVYTANEAREGVYVRSMLASGDFVAPAVANHLENGETVPDKPPLFHWIAAAATWARALATEGQSLGGADLAGASTSGRYAFLRRSAVSRWSRRWRCLVRAWSAHAPR